MKQLSELQLIFSDALRSSSAPTQALLDEIVDDGLRLQRFNVYRNNFVVLNGDALGEMYPVIKRLVGDDAFRMLATAYVREYPPMERALLLYGEQFPEFLSVIPELSVAPYLADVARMEYAWTAAYHAEDIAGLDERQLNGLPTEALASLHLRPHPSMHCIRSSYPVYRIWTANQSDQPHEMISLEDGPSYIVVIRPHSEVETREVSLATLIFLERLATGDTIGEAYTRAEEAESSFDLNGFFTRHLFDGTFCSIQE